MNVYKSLQKSIDELESTINKSIERERELMGIVREALRECSSETRSRLTQKIKTLVMPVEAPYCEEHDQEMVPANGFFICNACVAFEETGFAYECSDHGYFNGSCADCNYEESLYEEARIEHLLG